MSAALILNSVQSVQDVAGRLDHPGYRSGKYYGNVGPHGTLNPVIANRLYFAILLVPSRFNLDAFGVAIGNASSDTNIQGHFGLYTAVNGLPASLVVESANTGGFNAVADVDVGLTDRFLDPGVYYAAQVWNANGVGTPTLPGVAGISNGASVDITQWLYGGNNPSAYRTTANFLNGFFNDQTIASWAAYTLPTTVPALTDITAGTPCPSFTLKHV